MSRKKFKVCDISEIAVGDIILLKHHFLLNGIDVWTEPELVQYKFNRILPDGRYYFIRVDCELTSYTYSEYCEDETGVEFIGKEIK